MNDFYEKMRENLDRNDLSKIRGLSTRDVVAQNYNETELLKLTEELKAGPSLGDASFRLHSFIYERQNERVPEELRRRAADNVADQVRASEQDIDEGAVYIFIVWGTHRPDHKSVCLHLLNHPRAWVRNIALNYSDCFLQSNEYTMLFKFRQDPDVSEISMGGPLYFILRDEALHVLKRLTRCPVEEDDDCFEDTRDGRVFYKSWSPFLNWFKNQRH